MEDSAVPPSPPSPSSSTVIVDNTKLLRVIDGVRTVLSAAEQIYDSLRHYTVYAIDDRLAGILVRVLDPAGAYIGRLINALDRFDSVSRKGLPPATICRQVLRSCQDTLAVFGKLTIVLQTQLKVLAGTDDVRFTRKLNLLLYGATGEMAYAWQEMSPYLQEIKAYLQTGSDGQLLLAKGGGGGGGGARGREGPGPMTPVIEQGSGSGMGSPDGTPHADRSTASVLSNPSSIQARRARRHGGSYSQKDVELGKSLPSAGILPSPDGGWEASNWPPSASTPPLPGQRPTRPILTPSNSSVFSPTHHYQTPSPLPRSPAPFPSDSTQLFDGKVLGMMDSATQTANNVWGMLAELLDSLPEPKKDIRNALALAEQATEKVRTGLEAVRQDPTPAARKTLGEAAHQFARSVAQVLTLVRAFDAQKALPTELRAGVGRLTHATKEFTVFFQATSFAPRSRALSPGGAENDSPRMPILSPSLDARATGMPPIPQRS